MLAGFIHPSRWPGLLAGLLLVLLLTPLAAQAADISRTKPLPPGIHLPITVHLSSRILNISRIEETKSEISALVEHTLTWRDPTQAFDPLTEGTYRRDYYAAAAADILSSMWSPDVTIANQITEARSQTLALSVTSDGEVSMIRQTDADFRIVVNLAAFPFDRQKLDFVFTAPRYPANQVILSIEDRDRALSSISDTLSASDWHPKGLGFSLDQFYGWNAKPFVRATVTATVSRAWPRYLLRIFIPFAAVISVSLFILWAPDRLRVDQGGIIYSALLALAALSFTFESSFPGSMSVNSPIAFMISLGYFYLVLTLLVHLTLLYGNFPAQRRHHFLLREIRANIRFALPAIFALICACSVIRSMA